MTTAALLNAHFEGPRSVFTFAMDDHNVHCMTEEMLDAWWDSQTPAQKAEIFDRELDGLVAACNSIDRDLRRFRAGMVRREVEAGTETLRPRWNDDEALALGTAIDVAGPAELPLLTDHAAQRTRLLEHKPGAVVLAASRHPASLCPPAVDAVEGGR